MQGLFSFWKLGLFLKDPKSDFWRMCANGAHVKANSSLPDLIGPIGTRFVLGLGSHVKSGFRPQKKERKKESWRTIWHTSSPCIPLIAGRPNNLLGRTSRWLLSLWHFLWPWEDVSWYFWIMCLCYQRWLRSSLIVVKWRRCLLTLRHNLFAHLAICTPPTSPWFVRCMLFLCYRVLASLMVA